ncbi:MAG TPA: hypothetical protein EYQ54_18350 [Myxococcales bacterium]|nr:hypothetical protein [Myxococcales bacterium]
MPGRLRSLTLAAFRSLTGKRAGLSTGEVDTVRDNLERFIGKPMGPPTTAPEAVNVPMIRHWVDALDDRNPVYLDDEVASATRFGGVVAPPAMLQAWSMPRPRIEGIAERGGAPDEMKSENVVTALDEAGYVGTLATNSELEFFRYLRPGDLLHTTNSLESISARKKTGLGLGYFVTWITTFRTADDEDVGRQLFRIFKFDPSTMGAGTGGQAPKDEASPEGTS